MVRSLFVIAALLAVAVGCGASISPDQMWTDAAAGWTRQGATADERLRDYQECHQEGVEASTRSGRFRYGGGQGRPGRSRSGRLSADDLGRRATKRNAVLEECMADRGWTLTTTEAPG